MLTFGTGLLDPATRRAAILAACTEQGIPDEYAGPLADQMVASLATMFPDAPETYGDLVPAIVTYLTSLAVAFAAGKGQTTAALAALDARVAALEGP